MIQNKSIMTSYTKSPYFQHFPNSLILDLAIDLHNRWCNIVRSIVEEALQTYCKRWSKKEGVGIHAFCDWKSEFLRIVDIRIEHFTTHPHLYKQPPSRLVKALKRKMERLRSK